MAWRGIGMRCPSGSSAATGAGTSPSVTRGSTSPQPALCTWRERPGRREPRRSRPRAPTAAPPRVPPSGSGPGPRRRAARRARSSPHRARPRRHHPDRRCPGRGRGEGPDRSPARPARRPLLIAIPPGHAGAASAAVPPGVPDGRTRPRKRDNSSTRTRYQRRQRGSPPRERGYPTGRGPVIRSAWRGALTVRTGTDPCSARPGGTRRSGPP